MGKISKALALSLTLIIIVSCLTLFTAKPAYSQPAAASGEYTAYLQILNFSPVESDQDTYHQYYNSTLNSNMITVAYNPNFYQQYWNISKSDYYSDTFALGHHMGSVDFSYFNVTVYNNNTFPVNRVMVFGQTTKYGSIATQEPYNNTWIAHANYVIQPGESYLFPAKSTERPFSAYATAYIANNSESSTPTPSVPEFSWLVILPLFLSLFFVAVAISHRKTHNLKQ